MKHLLNLQWTLMLAYFLFFQRPQPIFSIDVNDPGIATISEGLIIRRFVNHFPAYEALQLLYTILRGWSRRKLRLTSHVRKRKRVPSLPTVWVAANPSNFRTPANIHFAVSQKGRNQWGGAVPWNASALSKLSKVNEYRSHTQARPLSIFFVVLLLNKIR